MLERSIPIVNESNQLEEVMFVDKASFESLRMSLLEMCGAVEHLKKIYGEDSNGIHQTLYTIAKIVEHKHLGDKSLEILDIADDLAMRPKLIEAFKIAKRLSYNHMELEVAMGMPYDEIEERVYGHKRPTEEFILKMSIASGKHYDWFFV